MLPQKHRLPSYEIPVVIKTGKQIAIWPIALFILKRPIVDNDQEYPRFAVIVPKRVSKLAVRRNRIKRLVRESLRHLFPILLPIDGVVFVKGPLPKELIQGEMEKMIKELLDKAEVMSVRT